MSIPTTRIVTACALIALSHIASAKEKERTYTPEALHKTINKIAHERRQHKNDADNQLQLDAMHRDIEKATAEAKLTFKTRITDVEWQDGFAAIKTTRLPRTLTYSSPAFPIALIPQPALYFPCEQEEAAAIELNTKTTITAALRYCHKVHIPLTNAPDEGPTFYALQSTQGIGGPLGYFTAPAITIKIGKKTHSVGKP